MGVEWDGGYSLKAISEWRPEARPAETKTGVERGQPSQLCLWRGLCCVTLGPRDPRPFLPRPGMLLPRKPRASYPPWAPFPLVWGRNRRAPDGGWRCCLPPIQWRVPARRAIGLVQNGGTGPRLGWAPHCGRDGGRVTLPVPTLSNSEACCQPQSTNGMTAWESRSRSRFLWGRKGGIYNPSLLRVAKEGLTYVHECGVGSSGLGFFWLLKSLSFLDLDADRPLALGTPSWLFLVVQNLPWELGEADRVASVCVVSAEIEGGKPSPVKLGKDPEPLLLEGWLQQGLTSLKRPSDPPLWSGKGEPRGQSKVLEESFEVLVTFF